MSLRGLWRRNREEQEIENSERQIGMYEAEIERIKAKIEAYQGIDGLIQKEECLAELKDEIRSKKKEIYDLKKVLKEQGNALERLSTGDEYNNKIKAYIQELRIWNDKVRDRAEKNSKR